MTEALRSNVNPPTLQSALVGVEGLKIHGVAMVTFVPGATDEKSPVDCKTNEVFQRFTRVAVKREVVSKVTVPPKSIVPTIGDGAVGASGLKMSPYAGAADKTVARPSAITASSSGFANNIFIVRFFIIVPVHWLNSVFRAGAV